MLIAVAWRNLWRNKLRSGVIILAVAIGIIGGVVTDGFMSGMVDQRVNSAIANEVSNIQIHNPGFQLNNELQYLIPHANKIAAEIRKYPQVSAVSLRLKCQAMASSALAGAGIMANGVIPKEESHVSSLKKHIVEGVYLNKKQRIPAVISKKLAKKLNIGIGDKVILTLADTSGTITGGAFQIVGIYKTSDDMFDEINVFVRKGDLARLVGFPSSATHEIAVLLNNNEQTSGFKKILDKKFLRQIKTKKIVIQSWGQLEPMLKSMVAMMNYFSYIFMVIILIALAFAIINVMLMAILERTREIGMLMALGMNKHKIFRMIMLETIFLSLAGAFLGLGISIWVIKFYASYGFDLSFVSNGLNAIGYSSIIYFRVNPNFYISTVIMVVIIAIIASIPPALKALKLQPATAIRDIK